MWLCYFAGLKIWIIDILINYLFPLAMKIHHHQHHITWSEFDFGRRLSPLKLLALQRTRGFCNALWISYDITLSVSYNRTLLGRRNIQIVCHFLLTQAFLTRKYGCFVTVRCTLRCWSLGGPPGTMALASWTRSHSGCTCDDRKRCRYFVSDWGNQIGAVAGRHSIVQTLMQKFCSLGPDLI